MKFVSILKTPQHLENSKRALLSLKLKHPLQALWKYHFSFFFPAILNDKSFKPPLIQTQTLTQFLLNISAKPLRHIHAIYEDGLS